MRRWLTAAALCTVLAAPAAEAQEYGARLGTVQRGGRVTYEPTGPSVLFDALDPVVRRWYVPQELYAEYRWKQWEYSNYAREPYQRYVSTALEGEYFYDMYGNLLTRGWLVYDWRQTTPQPFGSALESSTQYGSWFSNVIIASDHKGQYHYALTVGNWIRTTLTPMTFSKPRFNGLQWDFASDKWEATALLSRISQPSSSSLRDEQNTNVTNLLAGRLVAQVGDFVKVGGTFVNSHHAQTRLEASRGSVMQGQLTEDQTFTEVRVVQVRIRDDSPEDNEGGGALFGVDLLITDLQGNTLRASDIGFRPAIEGGFPRQGYLTADGGEQILVRYDLLGSTYTGPHPSEIGRLQVELVLANDYRVDAASNAQADDPDAYVFVPLARAPGNVKDGSNQRLLRLDCGLPTANQIVGFTLELTDVGGLDAYFEVDLNQQRRQYPNVNVKHPPVSNTEASAWLLNVRKRSYPYFALLEAYSIGSAYCTAMTVTDPEGVVDYGSDTQRFEYVEDNDDQDRLPDWRRKGSESGDEEVYPGWDENNDFISDFNQNDNERSPNLIPDYEEPFWRFHTDRPEFLYGMDMNHNDVIDRFENDEEPDYPYPRDRRGFNLYGGAYLLPEVRLTLGLARQRQLSDHRRSRDAYGILTVDRDDRRWGRLRLFQDLRRVRDDIVDDVLIWKQMPDTRGDVYPQADPLPARNTWINTTWIGWEQKPVGGLRLEHKLKWQLYHQRDDGDELRRRGVRRTHSFLGLIHKVEYRRALGALTLVPRWKSELRREVPLASADPRRLELSELASLLARFPVLHRSFVEAGMEYLWFEQLRDPVPAGAEPTYTEWVTTVQVNNVSDYLGYRLTTLAGLELSRLDLRYEPVQTRTRVFITLYGGVER